MTFPEPGDCIVDGDSAVISVHRWFRVIETQKGSIQERNCSSSSSTQCATHVLLQSRRYKKYECTLLY